MYKSVNMISPLIFHTYFETLSAVHQYDTRQASKGYMFMSRKNTLQFGLKSVRYASAKSWNSISDVIKQSPSVSIFRLKLKSYILSKNTKFKISSNISANFR